MRVYGPECSAILLSKRPRNNPNTPSLLQDPRSGIRAIAKFLAIDVSDEFIDTVTDRCHIEKMRKAAVEVKDDILNNFLIDGNPFMYRKGTL